MVAPSFTSNTTTVADGTDHIDPAQLRGLGPDQVLVLLNGKDVTHPFGKHQWITW
jgi:iron complex outermembrane receptor protein